MVHRRKQFAVKARSVGPRFKIFGTLDPKVASAHGMKLAIGCDSLHRYVIFQDFMALKPRPIVKICAARNLIWRVGFEDTQA